MSDGADVRAQGEAELQLGPYVRRVLRRLWIVALCVVAALGLASLRGRPARHATTQAQTTLYIGQPLNQVGNTVGGTVLANPALVATIAHDPAVIEAAARAAGLGAHALDGAVIVGVVGKASVVSTRGQYAPMFQVGVQGPFAANAAAKAADALAKAVVDRTDDAANNKIRLLTAQVAALSARVDAVVADDARLTDAITALARSPNAAAAGSAAALSAVLTANANVEVQLRSDLESGQASLGLARDVEASRVLTPAVGQRIEAAAASTGYATAALAGLVIGVLAALLLPPLGRRRL